MQGMVDFAQQCALIFAVLLPTFLYACAIGFFLFAAWGFWQQAHPHNPFRGKPWIPMVTLVMAGAMASFPAILSKTNISAGSSVTVSQEAGISSYSTATDPGDILGDNPEEALVNIVTAFEGFFQTFGAMVCFFAMYAWWAAMSGRSNRSWGACGVQFVFGICLINVLTITQWLANFFTSTATPS